MANLEVLFQQFKAGYENNWQNMQIRPGSAGRAKEEAARLQKNKSIYQQIETITRVPWYFIGLCHDRESGFDLNTYLGNGQALNRVTTIVPKGRGPFLGPNAFVDGAVDALRIQGFVGATDWSIARTLFRLEGFNGYRLPLQRSQLALYMERLHRLWTARGKSGQVRRRWRFRSK